MTASNVAFVLLGASVGLSAAIVVVLLRDRGVDPTLRWSLIGIAIAGATYTFVSGPARELLEPWQAASMRAASALGAALLWSVVRQLFDRSHSGRRSLVAPLLVWFVGMLLPMAIGLTLPGMVRWTRATVAFTALGLAGHMFWILIHGRRDDLDTFRRQLRLLLIGGGSLYMGAAFAAAYLGWRELSPMLTAGLLALSQIAFKLMWLALTVGAPSPLTRVYAITHADPPSPLAALVPRSDEQGAIDAAAASALPATTPLNAAVAPTPAVRSTTALALAAKQGQLILDEMESKKLYRRTGLSIGSLAEHLRLPEHRVRAVINGYLGFKNFTAFVGHFRLREVARRLRDPADAHLPILSIALDEGYASMGPFNRAFRDAFAMTPSEYRRSESADN